MREDSFQLNSAAVSDRGLSEKRPHNEDSFLEMNSQGLFAVADGVGGAQAGDVASQMAVEILGEAFANLRDGGGDAEEVMKVAIERANSAIFQMSHDLPQLSTMATTVVALQVTGNIATIGHVGDSRLYRLDPRGQLYRETQDHSVVEEEVRAGRMTPAQAANHPSRNVISRALGAEHIVEVDMKTIMIEPNTTFLLCSDGITRHIEDHEIRELLLSDQNPSEICARMKEICYSRGAEDNLTAVIVRVGTATNGMPADFEENTVAAARAAATSTKTNAATSFAAAPPETVAEDELEIPTRNLRSPLAAAQNAASPATAAAATGVAAEGETAPNLARAQQEAYLPEAQPRLEGNTAETINYPTSSETASSGFGSSTAAGVTATAAPPVRDEKIYTIDAEKGGGFLSKFLTAWLLLILGGIVGAALYHFLVPSPTTAPAAAIEPPPMPTQMQAKNIEYEAFEDARRNVDRNPELFIGAGGSNPQSAEDFYLLGRAYFLTGRYAEAKDAWTKAKTRISEVKTVNRKTLENEIALGLSTVENNIARTEFINQRRSFSSAAPTDANQAPSGGMNADGSQ